MRRIFLENLLANYLKNGILEKWLIFFRSDSDLGWHLWMLNFRGNNNNSNISKKIKKKPQMHSNNRSCLIATNAKRHQLKNREYKYQSISLSIYLCIYTYIYIYIWALNQLALTCSTLTIETREQGVKHVGRRSGIFIISFEHILHLVLVFLLLTYSET